jgi:hypothetical protein
MNLRRRAFNLARYAFASWKGGALWAFPFAVATLAASLLVVDPSFMMTAPGYTSILIVAAASGMALFWPTMVPSLVMAVLDPSLISSLPGFKEVGLSATWLLANLAISTVASVAGAVRGARSLNQKMQKTAATPNFS